MTEPDQRITVVDVGAQDRARRRRVQELANVVHRSLLRVVPASGVVRRIAAVGRERLRRALLARQGDTRALDADLAAFILGHAVEAVAHAVVLERPELLDDPRLGSELTELCFRYLRA